jgi:hypothetical protein
MFAAFLENVVTYGTVFGGIRRLLDLQVARLSPVEHDHLSRWPSSANRTA